MNANIDYLGILNLLHALCESQIISREESQKIAEALALKNGVDIIVFP